MLMGTQGNVDGDFMMRGWLYWVAEMLGVRNISKKKYTEKLHAIDVSVPLGDLSFIEII